MKINNWRKSGIFGFWRAMIGAFFWAMVGLSIIYVLTAVYAHFIYVSGLNSLFFVVIVVPCVFILSMAYLMKHKIVRVQSTSSPPIKHPWLIIVSGFYSFFWLFAGLFVVMPKLFSAHRFYYGWETPVFFLVFFCCLTVSYLLAQSSDKLLVVVLRLGLFMTCATIASIYLMSIQHNPNLRLFGDDSKYYDTADDTSAYTEPSEQHASLPSSQNSNPKLQTNEPKKVGDVFFYSYADDPDMWKQLDFTTLYPSSQAGYKLTKPYLYEETEQQGVARSVIYDVFNNTINTNLKQMRLNVMLIAAPHVAGEWAELAATCGVIRNGSGGYAYSGKTIKPDCVRMQTAKGYVYFAVTNQGALKKLYFMSPSYTKYGTPISIAPGKEPNLTASFSEPQTIFLQEPWQNSINFFLDSLEVYKF